MWSHWEEEQKWLWGTNMRFRLKCVRGVYKWVLVTVWSQPGRFLSWVYFSSISPTHRHRNKRVLRKGGSVCGIHACNPSPGEKRAGGLEVLDLQQACSLGCQLSNQDAETYYQF